MGCVHCSLCHHSPNQWPLQQQCLWTTKYYQLHTGSHKSVTSIGQRLKWPTYIWRCWDKNAIVKNTQNGLDLKKELLIYAVQPKYFHFARCVRMLTYRFMLCSVTRMTVSGCDHQWYPTPCCHYTIWCPSLSKGITTATCMRTFAALLKAAAQNLQKNSLLLTHLDSHTMAAHHPLNCCGKELLT